MKNLETHYLGCHCNSHQHLLKFDLDIDGKNSLLFASMYLDYYPRWYKRIWIAIKYILHINRPCSDFDEWILKHEDVEHLQILLRKYIELTS